MTSTTISMISLTLIWSAAGITARAMTHAFKISSFVNQVSRTEYQRHLCGSIAAARANLIAAEDLLKKMYPENLVRLTESYSRLTDRLAQSESTFSGDLNCREADIVLHSQSLNTTPLRFPNQVYRLTRPEL